MCFEQSFFAQLLPQKILAFSNHNNHVHQTNFLLNMLPTLEITNLYIFMITFLCGALLKNEVKCSVVLGVDRSSQLYKQEVSLLTNSVKR